MVQVVAAFFFISDAIADLSVSLIDSHTVIESLISVGLAFGAIFGIMELLRMDAQLQSHEKALAAAAGALGDVIEAQFTDWRLTPAERDVGFLALKGFDNAEIASLRGAATGTVRAQMTSIYGKAGVSGRAQFAAFFVEDLLVSGVGSREPAIRAVS